MACATALVERGAQVLMLDAGVRLEPERAQLVRGLSALPADQWSPEARAALKEGMHPSASGVPDKRLFGSDYPYRGADEHLGVASAGVGLRASLALGGLSTVWGAAMLPYLPRDIADWPITIDQLAPHYRSVLAFTGLSGDRDALEELLPTFAPRLGRLEMSRQARAMLQRLDAHRETLRRAGIFHGRARVAIKAPDAPEPGCTYCGFCMYGCPYGHIYKSEDTVARLQRSGRFTYRADFVAGAVEERAGRVVVTGHDRVTREPVRAEAERVYLAAGVVATTGILLRSLAAYDVTVRIKDSQYFLLPMFLTRGIANVRGERLHALSQIFVEILDDRVSPHAVHLQVYTFNDLIGQTVRKALGMLSGPSDVWARALEGRLVLVQGFIHSAHSSRIAVTLQKVPDGRERLGLTAEVDPQAGRTVRRVVRKLMRHARKLGAIPLPMLLQAAEPGRSFHAGGSFPMRARPGALETDSLGRPAGWTRVHAVDATVFPSIPATTITLSAMANAHRIGSDAAALN